MANGNQQDTVAPLFDRQDSEENGIEPLFDQQKEVAPLFDRQEGGGGIESLFDSDAQRRKPPMPAGQRLGPPPEEISPFDFSRQAIGQPGRRGVQNLFQAVGDYTNMLADFRKRVQEATPTLIPQVGDFQVAQLDWATRQLRRYAESINARPSNLADPEHWTEWFEPNRMWQTIAEGAPLTTALLVGFASNPVAATAAMAGLEGGGVHAQMERWEEETGEQVDPAYKVVAPIVVGSFNAMLERFAIERILKIARGAGTSTLNRTLFDMTMASINNAAITGTQAFTQAMSEVPYSGVVPNNLMDRVIEGTYSGFLLGAAMGGVSGVLGSVKQRRPDDVHIEDWVEGEDGRLEPTFRIKQPGHMQEGEIVPLSEVLGDENLSAPLWRRERLKKEMVEAMPDEFPDVPDATPELVAEMNLRIMESLAVDTYGYENVDAFIEEHNVIVKPGGLIEKGDLLQTEAFHGSLHDFNKFNTDHIGTGEGFQAFGWGLYFTESPQIAAEYARKLGQQGLKINDVPINSFKNIREQVVLPYLGESANDLSTIQIDTLVNDVEGTIREISDHVAGDATLFEVVRDDIAQGLRDLQDNKAAITASIIESISPESVGIQQGGIVYKVTLNKGRNTDEYKWMPWRDRMNQQDLGQIVDKIDSDIQTMRDRGNIDAVERLRQARENIDPAVLGDQTVNPTGANLYRSLAQAFGSERLASKFLEEAGFDGTKYEADAGRSSSYNYVVFNDSIVTIEGKDTLYQRDQTFMSILNSKALKDVTLKEGDHGLFITSEGTPIGDTNSTHEDILFQLAETLFEEGIDLESFEITEKGRLIITGGSVRSEAGDAFFIKPPNMHQQDFKKAVGQYLRDVEYKGDVMLQDSDPNVDTEFVKHSELTKLDPPTLGQRDQGRPKASVNFSDGATMIKIFQSADPSSVLHELAHVFRRFMPEQMLRQAEEAFGVEDGNWTRAKEEQFARSWEEWFARGRRAGDANANIFTRFRDWLVEIYGRANRTLVEHMSQEQIDFLDTLFESVQDDLVKMPDGRRETMLGHWFEKMFDIFDIETAGRRIGLPDTFFHLKNRFSTEAVYVNEALNVVTAIPSSVRASRELSADAVMLAEDAVAMENVQGKPRAQRTDVEQAAVVMREYFDASQMEYEARRVDVGFKERLLGELQAKLETAQLNDADNQAIQNILNEINDAQEVDFIHIPFNFWFRHEINRNPQNARRIWLEIEAVARRRETLQIKDLVDAGIIKKSDVRPADILTSYSKIKGKDFALMNIRDAAINEQGIIPRQEGEGSIPGYKTPPPNMRIFKGYQIRDPLYHWMTDQMSPSPLNRFQSAFNTVKMWAFWNPLFLPMYDIVQSHMAGAMNILNPIRTFKQIKRGFNDVLNWTADARVAQSEGLHSVPFNNPLEQLGANFDIAARTWHSPHAGNFTKVASWVYARGEHMFADILEKTFDKNDNLSFLKQIGGVRPFIRNMYEMSWTLAWFLDNTVRQVTYNHFLDLGYSPRDAAQMAARAHADYASVPPKTRKMLNTVFFTPTFKIAMGKWMADSIRSLGNVMAGDATISQKQRAAVLGRTLAILGAFDMMMLALDFERDEWGRRYTRPVDTQTGQRELVINWTGPHNMFLKYMQRAQEAFGPEVPNPMLRVFQQNSWEITPLLRVMQNVVTNTTPSGDKIWMVSDDSMLKVMKAFTFATTTSINVLAQLAGEEEFGKDGAEAFAREYGQMLQTVTAPFVFKYTRQTPEIRLQQKLQMMMAIHAEEVEARNLFTQMMRRGQDPRTVVDQYIHGKGPFDITLEQRSENLVRRMQQLIWDYEAEHYDQWSEDVRNLGVPGRQGGGEIESLFD